jgi:hypothetical protein
MGAYDGEATIIAPDGTEATIAVRLISATSPHGLGSWRGTATGSVGWSEMQGSDDVRLRVGDRSGKVLVSWREGDERANLTGIGEAPFD